MKKYVLFLSCLFFMTCDREKGHQPEIGPDGYLCASDAVWSHGEGDLQNTKRATTLRNKDCIELPITTPQIRWTYELGGAGTRGAPVIGDDGTIYIVADSGQPPGGGIRNMGIMAINPSGNLKWFFSSKTDIGNVLYARYGQSVAVGKDNTIYSSGWDSAFYAIKLDGTLKWKHVYGSTGHMYTASPVIDPRGRIYGGRDSIICFKPNGEIVWAHANADFGLCYAIALGKQAIYCGFPLHGILALDYNGNVKWMYDNVDFFYTSYGIVVDEDDNIYFKVGDNAIQSVNSSGQPRWNGGGGGVTQPVLRGDYIYFGVSLASLLRIRKDTGDEDTVMGVLSKYIRNNVSPLIDDNGNICMGTSAYPSNIPYTPYLECFNQKAEHLWSLQLQGSTYSGCEGRMALGRDGTIYVATVAEDLNGIYKLFAIK